MADYIHVDKVNNPWDFIKIEKCAPPITGHQQAYRVKAGCYVEQQVVSFVINEDELKSLKKQLEALENECE